MAEKFILEAGEFVEFKRLATWVRGGLNNTNGTIHITNRRFVYCARNRWKTYLLGGALLDIIWRSKKIRFQLNLSDIESITTYKYMGIKTHFRINKKGEEGENYRVVFNGNNEFKLWSESAGFIITDEKN